MSEAPLKLKKERERKRQVMCMKTTEQVSGGGVKPGKSEARKT
jgi:hypothetical protein